MAAHLLTRADVIEAAKKEHSRRLHFWQSELGVDDDSHADQVRVKAIAQAALPR
jgi:hypothetical protein